MVQSSPQPEALGYNPNASNALSPYLGYSFSQAACQSSSPCMTEVSSSIQSLDINDENTPPPSVHAGNTKIIHSSGGHTSEENELALVKAELEATLRKLAQYEGQKADVPHTRPQLVKYNPTSRNLFPGKQSTSINPQAMLGCRHPSSAQVPAPPHPLPVEAASAELSPLHLPSPLGGVFPARDGFSSGFGLSSTFVSSKAVPLPPQETLRNISSTLPPIGGHLRSGPMQRRISLDAKNPPGQTAWNADSEWSPPRTSSYRTQTGQQPVLGSGLLEPWHDVFVFLASANIVHSLSWTWIPRASYLGTI